MSSAVLSVVELDRSRLVEDNYGLAVAIAKRMRGRRDEDLEQVAMIGLVKASQRFDPERNIQFATFAWQTIEGEIKRYFRDTSWSLHVNRSLHERSLRVTSCVDELTQRHRRSPTAQEIASYADCSVEQVLEALELQRNGRTRLIDTTGSDDHGVEEPGEIDVSFSTAEDRLLLDVLLTHLSERDRSVVKMRFYDQLSQSEIGLRMGISQMHVSRVLLKSMTVLRSAAANRYSESMSA